GPYNVIKSIIQSYPENRDVLFKLIVFSNKEDNDLNCLSGIEDRLYNVEYYENLIGYLSFIKKYREKKNHTIFHSHCIRSSFIFSFLNSPHVATSHNIPTEDWVLEKGKIRGLIIGLCQKFLLINSTKLITISNRMQSYFSQGELIYNGVNISRFNMVETITRDIDIIFCGRLIERKNPIELLKFAKDNFPNARIAILGEGELLDEMHEMIKSDHLNVTFYGKVSNPEFYYNKSRYFFSSSLTEGMPLSVLEAALCGCKLLLSDIQPHQEIASLLNNSGVQFINKNIDFSQLDNEMIAERSKAVFSSNLMAKKYADVYESVE
uniref:glycosyltransferase family 4 protein n=1 Tax=Vibrio coralliirubri TaxID=1516159 RepID=UPI000EFBAE59